MSESPPAQESNPAPMREVPPLDYPAEIPAILTASRAAAARGDTKESERLVEEFRTAYRKWATQTSASLYRAGIALASTPSPEPPPQASQMIALGKQAESLEVPLVDNVESALRIFRTWTDVRLQLLSREATVAAARGGPTPPPQLAEMTAIHRQLVTLGLDGRDDPFAEVRSILFRWVDVRLEQLRTDAMPLASEGRATPPEAIREVYRISRTAELMSNSSSSAPEPLVKKAVTLAEQLTDTWVDARAEVHAKPGREVAAAGGSQPISQVDSLVRFARELECGGSTESNAPERVRRAANDVAARQLRAIRVKLPCPIAEPARASYGRLAGRYTSVGLGPFPQLSECKPKAWSGTITVIQVSKGDTARTALSGGSQRLWERTLLDSVVTRIEVEGDRASATVRGRGRAEEHFRFLDPACSVSGQEGWERRTSTFSGAGASTVTIEQVGSSNDYVVRFTTPAYTEQQEIEVESRKSESCPMGGGKRQRSMAVNHRAGGFPIRATGVPIASLIAGEESLAVDLEGSSSIPLKGFVAGGGDQVITIRWKLTAK